MKMFASAVRRPPSLLSHSYSLAILVSQLVYLISHGNIVYIPKHACIIAATAYTAASSRVQRTLSDADDSSAGNRQPT